ncbi:MAG TPA: hypothetical protein VIC57_08210 [Candidatus Dormibacteraeota bacterium]
MTEAIAVVGAALAWLGVTLLAVAEGRRGLALGLVMAAAGLATAAAAAGQSAAGVTALVAGGLLAAALRLRSGGPGWNILPPGSTPRLMAALIAVLGAGLVASSEIASPGGAARVAALVVAALAIARILTTDRRWAALGAGSALALGLGTLGGTIALVTGAAVAVGLGAIDGAEPAEAGG